jgi:hypothetical protein
MASLLTVGSVLAGSFAATTVATAATGDYIDVVTTEADARTGRLFHLFVIDVDVSYECQPTGADTSGVIEFPVHAHTRTGIEAVCDGTDRTATLPNVAVYSNQSTVEVKLSSPEGLAAAVVAQDTAVIFVTGPSNTPITPPTSSPHNLDSHEHPDGQHVNNDHNDHGVAEAKYNHHNGHGWPATARSRGGGYLSTTRSACGEKSHLGATDLGTAAHPGSGSAELPGDWAGLRP